ncbi:MAG TPA: radical SAM family heme chaperone HemW [Gammaproteobacteria bacterium]
MPPRSPSRPLSLYVHLPWCLRKCPYCDFNSYRADGVVPEDRYVDALLRDLEAESALAAGRPIESIYIGGGTPSLFSGGAVARLLDGVRAGVDVADDAETTLEANPGAADAARFAAYREAGVTRLSIGVQSFRTAQLRALGRVHDGSEAERAVRAASAAGFENVNVDLMYGLPGDSVAGAAGDVEHAIALGPSHVSWYQLTLEPHTAFHRRPPPLPAEDVVLEIEAAGRALLASAGYERYEVSAYARAGFRCRHNLNYWRFGDYIGIGAGAHGKLTAADGTIVRRAKTRNPRTYIDVAGTDAAVVVERITVPSDIVLEFMMNALRLADGVTVDEFEARTGQRIDSIDEPLTTAIDRGWIERDGPRLRTTPRGYALLNEVLGLFVDA